MMVNNINNTSQPNDDDVQVDMWRAVPLSLILLVIDLATVIGNAIVILAVVYDYSLRSMATNFYVVSLAAADLMIGLLVLPFSATYEILGYWIFGQYFCVFWAMVDVLCCTASILSLVAISLDRYLAISKPMHYPRFSTSKISGLCIFGVWFLAILVSIPPLFGWRSERKDYSQCELTSGKGYVTYSALGSFYIPSIVLISVYFRIYIVAARHTRNIKQGQIMGELRSPNFDLDRHGKETAPSQLFNVKAEYRQSTASSASQEPFLLEHKHRQRETLARRLKKFAKDKRAAKTLAIVVGAFLICWSPFFFVYLIGGVCDSCQVPESIFKIFFWLGYCNSFLNPIIYPCLNRDFKRAFKRILQRTYCNRYGLDFYDSPRRSMRIIRASRKLRMSMPDSRSSSSPPDSPNLALARRQSLFKEIQIRRASAILLKAKENLSVSSQSRSQFRTLSVVDDMPMTLLEEYDTSPRRLSVPAMTFSYSPPVHRTFVAQESVQEEDDPREWDRQIPGSIVSIDGNNHYHTPFYPSYFRSEPNISDTSWKTRDIKLNTKRLSKQTQSEDDLNLSLLDIPHIYDGEMSRRTSRGNSCISETALEPQSSRFSNYISLEKCDKRDSLDVGDSYFWDCIAQLRRKSAEARAAQKLGLSRVASCEYELSLQQSTWGKESKARSPFFLSLSHLNLPEMSKCDDKSHTPFHMDKSVQTDLTSEHFEEGRLRLQGHDDHLKQA